MLDSEVLEGVPLLVVCNKCDQEVITITVIDGICKGKNVLQEALSVAQIKDAFAKATQKIGRRDCHVIRASALNGCVLCACIMTFRLCSTNIHESIDWICDHVVRNAARRPPREAS